MKKSLLIILCAILGLTACQKDDLGSGSLKEGITRITVGLDNVAKTRTAYSDPSLSGMRVVLIVSHKDKVVFTETKSSHDFATAASFDVRLVSDQAYTVSCWADFGSDYYTLTTTEGAAPSVAMTSYDKASDNKRDAYFASKAVTFTSNASTRNVDLELTRPFALIKVNTTDYNEATVKAGFRPSTYTMTVTAPTSMSLLDGVAGTASEFTLSGNVSAATADVATQELSFDYLFASSERTVISFDAAYTATGGAVSYSYTNIPVQRNYRTNISGNILTKSGNVTVTIDQLWGDINVGTNETATSDFETKIIAAKNSGTSLFEYVFAEPVSAVGSETSRTFSVPDVVTGDVVKEVLIDFSAGIKIPISIEDKTPLVAGTNYVGAITVVVPSVDAAAITFNLPNAHVIVKGPDGTIINEIIAKTSSSTLEIKKGITITNLKVDGGNVDVYGTVTNISRTDGNTDAKTVVRIFPDAVVTNRGTDDKIEYVEVGDIVNLTTNISYPNVTVALAAAKSGETVQLSDKTFNIGTTGITIPAGVTLQGIAGSVVSLAAIGHTSAWAVSINGGTLDGVEVRYAATRNPEDAWNNENPGGVLLSANATLKNSKVTNFRNGVYANNVKGITIENNIITANRTGIQFANAVGASVTGNTISDNVTMGILVQYLTANAGDVPTFTNNTFYGNWYSDFENRFPAAQSPYVINLDGNTFSAGTKTVFYGTSGEYSSGVQGVKPASQAANVVTAVPANITLTDAVVLNKIVLIRSGAIVGFSYTSIASAMTAATANDVIYLGPGVFTENVELKNGVTLEGSGTGYPVGAAETQIFGSVGLNQNSTLKNLHVAFNVNNGNGGTVAGSPNGVTFARSSGITYNGVRWSQGSRYQNGGSSGQQAYPILTVYNAHNLVVTNCRFEGSSISSNSSYNKGIYINSANTATITNNFFGTMHPFSMDAYPTTLTVTGNTFTRSAIASTNVGFYRPSGSGTTAANWSQDVKDKVNMCIEQNTWTHSGGVKVKTWESGVSGSVDISNSIN